MIVPIMPFFLTQSLNASTPLLGFSEGIRELTAGLSGIVSGTVSDKLGKKKNVVISGYSISTMAKTILYFATSPFHVAMGYFFDRLGKGIRVAPRDSLMIQSEDATNLGTAIGVRKMFDYLGALIGPLLVTFLLTFVFPPTSDTYRLIFLLALIPSILSVFILFFSQEKNGTPQSAKMILHEILSDLSFRKLLLTIFIFSIGNFSVSFFLLRSSEFLMVSEVALAYFVYNLSSVIFSIPAGRISEKIGGSKTLIISGLFFLAGIIGLGFFVFQTILIYFYMALLGAFIAFYETAPRLHIAKTMPAAHFASSIGLYRGVNGIGAFIANVIGGILFNIRIFSAPGLFTFSIATTLFAILLTFKIK